MKTKIIGNGDIAKVLKDVDVGKKLFFASGVSNSQEARESEYKREVDLLLEQDKNQHVIYISSLCVFYSDTRYAQHKRLMEKLIKNNFLKHTIIRIGNITWGTNPHTIINFFKNKIARKEDFEIKEVYRYLVAEDEFLYWINLIPKWNCEMNISGRKLKVSQIVEEIKQDKL